MAELSVPIQVLFATPMDTGVLIDGLVIESTRGPGGRTVGAGEPFSLLMERGCNGADDRAALAVLRRWSDESSVVEAATTQDGHLLVMRSGDDELVLVIS